MAVAQPLSAYRRDAALADRVRFVGAWRTLHHAQPQQLDGLVRFGQEAVVGITQQAALELGPKNIRVNAICPGAVSTGMTKDFVGSDEFTKDKAIARWGKPEEIANMALFLASDESSFVTGAAIPVDGGWGAR